MAERLREQFFIDCPRQSGTLGFYLYGFHRQIGADQMGNPASKDSEPNAERVDGEKSDGAVRRRL